MESNKKAVGGSGSDGGEETGRTSQKRSLSRPGSSETEATGPKRLRQTCRESTDEDDIKVLKSDYSRTLDEDKNKKDSDLQSRTDPEDMASAEQSEREGENYDQNNLAENIKVLKEQNFPLHPMITNHKHLFFQPIKPS